MNTEKWFKEKLDEFKDDVEFYTEEIILDFTEKIVTVMEEMGINRAELARKLGVSKAFITKLLNGNPNLTIKTMVSLAKTLDRDLNIDLGPEGFEVKRFYVAPTKVFDVSEFTEDVTVPPMEGEINAIAA